MGLYNNFKSVGLYKNCDRICFYKNYGRVGLFKNCDRVEFGYSGFKNELW